jgi:capsule polysaccharide export protein KpsE/RkpR
MFLEARLAQVKQDLESSEKNFSEFASKNTALDIQEQGKAMIEAGATLEGQMIGMETELQSLKQIYSDGNVRVRATQARVDELRRQLEKLGGKFDTEAAPARQQDDQSLYPSIRRLPLLGVGYADLYRNTKMQEAIFETLTQGYELAKVQEVKETPSVMVIDSPDVPGKKSFPHRSYIVLAGLFFSIFLGAAWILGNDQWMKIDRQDPRKLFALEIFNTVAAYVPSIPTHGNGIKAPGRNGSTPENSDRSRLEK